MYFLILIKHCDSIWLEYSLLKFMNHVKNLMIIILQMGIYGGDDHKYVVN
jgi:hypothetical protein